MRKIGAILLVFCMALSFAAIPAFADGEIVIDATADVKTFYDNGMNGGNGNLETLNGDLMLRQCGEWVTYDISELAKGTYSVDVTYKSNANVVWKNVGLDFAVDGGLELRAYLAYTGAWSADAATANAGKIYVSEGAKELKVKNHGMYPINLDVITLTYVGEEDTSEDILIYGQNATSSPDAAKTGAEFYLGVDYWDVATGTASEYTKEDENGNMHLPFTSGSILQTTKLVQHAGDWARYDISDFKAGTYEVTLNRALKVDSKYALKIDGKTALEVTLTKTADEYGVYVDGVVGKIYIAENSEYLTLLNEGSGSVYVDNIKFKYLSAERDSETIPSVSFYGVSVIPGGQGVGYWANSMASGSATLETNNTQAVLRQGGEWVAYDVSDVESGVYTLNLSYTVREDIGFYLDIYVDDVLQAKIKPPKTTNSLGGAPDTIEACNIEITSDSKVLKIRNSSRCVTNICALELGYVGATSDDDYVIRQYGDHASLHDANGVSSYVSGEDLYDVGGKDITGHMEYGIYISDKGDWVRYDIKGLRPGTYEMVYNYASKVASQLKVKIDGELMICDIAPATNPSAYGTYADNSLGNVYIPEGAEYLVLANEGDGTIYSKYFELKLIDEEQTAWPSLAFRASGVIPGGQGVGYYDSASAGTIEMSGSNVTLRATEWLKYDVSELKPGTYSVTTNNAATASVDFSVYVDDALKLLVNTPKTGTSWSNATYEDNYLGSVYIGENTETITVKNTSASANTFLSKVVLDSVSDEDDSVMSINILAGNVLKDEGEIIEGVGFYDAGGESKFEASGNGFVLRQDDWARYDLSEYDLPAGIYTVYASLSTNATSLAGISVEGESTQKITELTGAISSEDEVEVGKIVVGEDTGYFTLSCENGQRFILFSLRIASDVEANTVVKYTSDAEGKVVVDTVTGLESAYVTVSLIRPKTASIGETVYIALYEGNRLASVKMVPVTDGYRYDNTFELTGLNDAYGIKTFIWDSKTQAPVIAEEILAQG